MKAPRLLSLVTIFAAVMLVLPMITRADEPDAVRSAGVGVVSTATVKSIDADAHTVTLQTADGDTRTVNCGKEVRNFDQIKVGDLVKAVAIGEVAVSVGKPGMAGMASADKPQGPAIIARAPTGDKPGVIIANTMDITAKIDDVNADKHTITLTGAAGTSQPIDVSPDVDLSNVKKGDDITLSVTKGVALWVEKPQDAGAQPAAEQIKAQGTEEMVAGGMAAREVGTATVESVDPATRMVTLKTAKGETKSIHLGKEAVNFDQIKAGDKVRAILADEIAISVSKGGPAPSDDEGGVIMLAPKGDKPGMLIADTDQISGKIQSIDTDKRMITFTQADGTSKTVKAGRKVDISQLKAGDDITARVTEALAIVVEKP